jgi:gas vesicle protein
MGKIQKTGVKMLHSVKSFKDFLLGLAIGGSLSAFMCTTKRGKQVQKDILKKYHMLSNKAQHLLKDGIEKLTGHHPKVKKTVKRKKKR